MGSQRESPARMSNDRNQAIDDTYATNNSSPTSFSFSDYSSNDSNDDINDGGSQSGPSVIRGDQRESPSSSEANEELSSESLNMVKPHKCDRCPRSFEKRHQLNRHIRWHEKPEKCPKCPYTAQYKKGITRHVWVHHSKWAENTNYPSIQETCKICKTILQRPDYVKRHMKEVHRGIKRQRGPRG
ncbi:uncharacterized protein TrAFT101_002430 [Trichoderma asperellum]|uniref:C2H2-type domain-containing protein n=1 Tax=Trichoderma asperellum (strain ATCC 204424 / CBS 433.97 / NBRC 101777) TaxID=1042311 RepID=A0A2T3ZGE4_TRIA4|nr:hypothetical protein M441DRAFT_336745 [Trichoderma asperellum CBS 433.97]PTB43866.1 hypothetical protein M441DRAFT_336745 [Trichoderma asperellum CBS 433.97]UKZ86604.1 hypothetical protein TrAFT101_002430 [Trichoderma asperellum]